MSLLEVDLAEWCPIEEMQLGFWPALFFDEVMKKMYLSPFPLLYLIYPRNNHFVFEAEKFYYLIECAKRERADIVIGRYISHKNS